MGNSLQAFMFVAISHTQPTIRGDGHMRIRRSLPVVYIVKRGRLFLSGYFRGRH